MATTMSQDLVRIIDGICRDKNIERETFFTDLENAITSAVRKAYGEEEDTQVHLDPLNGQISATVRGEPVDMVTLGRIAAQTAKQVIIQKTRERERVSIYEDFSERQGTILTGTVVRIEGANLLVNIGRTEGFLPRSERIPGETHQVGERIRVMILDVREQGNQVKVVLSRSHPDFIVRLFELEVPEVAERVIEIRALAREAGYRTKVAVSSIDTKVDAVGACVGVRGSRIKNIVDELSGEKIDIVRWNESSQILIQNALKPAEVQEIALCFELGKASVVVAEDQLSLAIGKRGQNVRLAARLTKWDIDIITPEVYNKNLEILDAVIKSVGDVDDIVIDKLMAVGIVSVMDLDDVGPELLVSDLELEQELADKIVEAAGEEVIRQEEEKEAAAKAKAEQDRAAEAASGFEPESSSQFVAAEGEGAPPPAAPPAEPASDVGGIDAELTGAPPAPEATGDSLADELPSAAEAAAEPDNLAPVEPPAEPPTIPPTPEEKLQQLAESGEDIIPTDVGEPSAGPEDPQQPPPDSETPPESETKS
jgi:N utilization substance protein A